MKLNMERSALLEGLQIVQNVVSTKSTLPILSNVLVNAEKESVSFATTDLEVSVSCRIKAVVADPGSTTLPVKRLLSIVRELPDSEIEMEIDDKDTASVTCGASFFKIIGLSSDEFPPVPETEGKYCYHLDQGIFREMLKKTAYAASTDETRFVLNGVLLSFKDEKLTMVATDGRRLALVENEVEIPPEAEQDMILPSKAVSELVHVLKDEGELRVYSSENQLMFDFEDVMMSSTLIDGTYPNFRQVIPAECEERVSIEREILLTALKRVSLLTADRSSASKLTFADNQLIVSTNTPEVGEARESIPIKYGGKKITVAFNPEYMMDPLRNLSNDEIAVELTDDLSPGVIKCDIPFLYVLMPMRVD